MEINLRKTIDHMLTIWSHWALVSFSTVAAFDMRFFFEACGLTAGSIIIYCDIRANMTSLLCIVKKNYLGLVVD